MASNRLAEERCEHYMSEHHGVIHRATALSLGMPGHAIHRRVRTGAWERVFDDVLKRRSSPLTWEGTALAGCLQGGDGFVVAGGAALRLLGFREYKDAPPEIAGPTHANVAEIVCHRYRDMIPEDALEVKGLPCRRFEPTLLELCGGTEGYKAGPLLDEALRRKLTCLAWLYRTLHRYGKRGRAGTVRFRSLLAQRDDTVALTDSELEAIFLRAGSRLTRKPVMHYVVRVGDKTLEIDFAYPSLKIAIELDGFDEHGKHVRFESDRARDVILQNDGWIVLRFTWFQLVHDHDWVFEQINKAVATRS